MLTLQTVVDGVKIASEPRLQLPAALANLPIRSACIDSREASVDGLFVALQGERVDGHDFIAAAAARGVRAALVQRGRLADPSQLGLDRPFVLLDPDQGQIANEAPANAFFLISVDQTLTAMHRLATRYRQQQDLVVVGITGSVGKTSTKEVLAAMLAPTMRTHKSPRSYNSENTLPLVVLGIEPEHQIAVLEMGIYNKGDLALLTTIAQPKLAS